MPRTVLATLAALGLCIVLVGCSNEGADAADELGVQQGRRPVAAEKRTPPGPPDGTMVAQEQPGEEPAATGDDQEPDQD